MQVTGGNAGQSMTVVSAIPRRLRFATNTRAQMSSCMAQPISSTARNDARTAGRSAGLRRRLSVGGAVLGAAVLLGALVLWFHYGTAVFFEMIASGIAACF